jgi:hypothetical protein
MGGDHHLHVREVVLAADQDVRSGKEPRLSLGQSREEQESKGVHAGNHTGTKKFVDITKCFV